MKAKTVAWVLALVWAAAPWALAQPGTAGVVAAPASQPAGDVSPKVSPLLAFVLNQVATMATDHFFGDSPLGLFRRLLGLTPALKPEAAPLADGALAPVVGYALQQLDPQSFEVVKPLALSGHEPPLLRTGDVFALLYSTNLPGQVRLENIDPRGQVSDLGVYTVLPDQLNRLPRDLGIKLVGQPGAEIIRFYFYPCLPPGSAGAAWAGRFAGKLPDCGRGPNPVVQAAASGALKPKALVNLAQPDETMSFAGAADYRLNDVTSTVAVIRHEAR
jgi:hypothetical protein